MAPGHLVSDDLIEYHRAVSEGGVGMTTVAYAAVSQSGLSFDHQLWLRREAVPGLRRLTNAVHSEGAAAAIQIGHCGLMAKKSVSGGQCFAPSGRFNLYGPTWPITMKKDAWMKPALKYFGNLLMKPEPFSEGYFLEDALKVREVVKLHLIYVGGLVSLEKIEEVLGKGFEFVQIARALINDPAFINKLRSGEITRSACKHSNYCIAVMYSDKMRCYQKEVDLPEKWKRKLGG